MKSVKTFSVQSRISEKAVWINLIFYSMMTHIPGVLPMFSDFQILKIDDLGLFFHNFFRESDLRDGCVESFDILQHDDLYYWADACLHGF